MERIIIVTILVIALFLALNLIALPDKNLDGPAGAVGCLIQSGGLKSFDFSSENPTMLADEPAPPICINDPLSC